MTPRSELEGVALNGGGLMVVEWVYLAKGTWSNSLTLFNAINLTILHTDVLIRAMQGAIADLHTDVLIRAMPGAIAEPATI